MSSWLTRIAVLITIITTVSCFIEIYPSAVSLDIPPAEDEPLPKTLTPSGYYLKLFPRLNESYFNGTVKINVTCQESTHTVVLHAHESLNIVNELITVTHLERNSSDASQSEFLHIISILKNASADTLIITLQEELQFGSTYQLYMHFNSFFNTEYLGFFKGSFTDMLNQEISLYAGTFMSTRNARRVFPCFDEPSFKATFQISVAHLSNMSALSMMPLESTEIAEEEGWVWNHFQPSPPISTFSVNLLVSYLENDGSVNPSSTQDVSVQTHVRYTHIFHRLRNVSNIVPKMLKYLQDFLDVAYPVPKLDVVALPNFPYNFQANSLGLLVVRESRLERDGLLTLAHDLVYQFINHIITPRNWTDFFVTNIVGSYLAKSGFLKLSNKENFYVTLSADLYQKFSMPHQIPPHSFNYYKIKEGEWFVRMLKAALTENTFKRGLSNLISVNKFSTFTEEMLWTALTHQAQMDGMLTGTITVNDIAKSWLHGDQFYVPLVTVTRNYEDGTAFLKQQVFVHDPMYNLTEEEQRVLWRIPIMYLTPDNLDPTSLQPIAWMPEEHHFNISNLPDENSFIIVNPTDAGFFLVNYDQHNWKLISHQLMTSRSQFPTATRIKLLNDAWILATGGQLNFATALNMTLFLQNETDTSVWLSMIKVFQDVKELYRWTPAEDRLVVYLRDLLSPIYESMDLPDINDDLQYEIYSHIRHTLCEMGYQPCIAALTKQLTKRMPTFLFHDNNTQSDLICPEFLTNASDDWETNIQNFVVFRNIMYNEFYHKHIAKCPGYVQMVGRILNGTLDENLNSSTVNWNVLVYILTSNPTSYNATFNFLLQNFDVLQRRFGSWDIFIEEVTNKFKTEEGLNKLTEFYSRYKNKLSENTQKIVEESIKKARLAASWGKENLPVIDHWFHHTLPSIH